MYRKILIANRADCALRLIQACHAENIQACVICARDDVHTAVHQQADDIVYTGMTRDAYTSIENILEAAYTHDCEAILPGWGFLSEDFTFARRCRHMGLHFIGPKTEHIQRFGDKLKTIQTLAPYLKPNTTIIPCHDPQFKDLLYAAPQTSWMLKPRFGGGGKGLERFESADALCLRLAQMPQNLRQYYVEPLLNHARHIEFQIFGDGMGRIDLMGVRDCTPQVRHQKWLEQSVDMTNSRVLSNLGDAICKAFAALKYQSWGTVEFLVHDDHTALLEVNPRLQVEHGVTEMALNTDIVRRAIRLSCMGPQAFDRISINPLPQNTETAEFRLYARSPGTLQTLGFEGFQWPHHPYTNDPNYRLETTYMPGDIISGVYDGMLARFITRAPQGQALNQLKTWLQRCHIDGIETNLSDLQNMS